MPSIHQDQIRKWQLMGAEPVFDRGTVRLPQFRKTFGSDIPVTVFDREAGAYRPLVLSDGKPLMAHEVLPERADLALDKDGRVLNQGDFAQNYEVYLDSFIYPAGSNPRDEPVPNVVAYVREMPDPYSESSGSVEIRFDPKLDKPFRPIHRFGPNGESEEEWKREQAKSNDDQKALLKMLAETQAQMAALLAGNKMPPVLEPPIGANSTGPDLEEQPEPEPAPITPEEAVAATDHDDRELSPCGRKYIRKGYTAQHVRHCDAPECGGESVNSKRSEAA